MKVLKVLGVVRRNGKLELSQRTFLDRFRVFCATEIRLNWIVRCFASDPKCLQETQFYICLCLPPISSSIIFAPFCIRRPTSSVL